MMQNVQNKYEAEVIYGNQSVHDRQTDRQRHRRRQTETQTKFTSGLLDRGLFILALTINKLIHHAQKGFTQIASQGPCHT